jgi:hypothetical protein
MSTQRRVVPGSALPTRKRSIRNSPEPQIPSSPDAGVSGSKKQFRRVANGLTASIDNGRADDRLATNSLSFSSCCEWNFRNTACGCFFQEADTNGSSPAFVVRQAGILPEQLPPISPPPIRCLRAGRMFRSNHAVGLAAGPNGHLPWDGKATWPRKFVSQARRTKRGLQFWKTISSRRFITSGKMNIPSRVRFTRAA